MAETVSEVVEELLSLLASPRTELADAAEVSYASLHAWSTGRRSPTRENALRLARLAQERAVRISELSGRLSLYARTGELTRPAPTAGGRSREPRHLDRERLRQIRDRSRLLRDEASETVEWIRHQQDERLTDAGRKDADERREEDGEAGASGDEDGR